MLNNQKKKTMKIWFYLYEYISYCLTKRYHISLKKRGIIYRLFNLIDIP